jgi:hypothetical protein
MRNQEQWRPDEADKEQQRGGRRVPPVRNREGRPDIHSNQLQERLDGQELEADHQREYREQRRRIFKRKREEHYDNTARGVNIPQISRAKMRRVKKGFVDLFKTEINPIMKEFVPKSND